MPNPGPSLQQELASMVVAQDVLNSLADGVYVTDRDRRIVFWNAAAERITGWTRQEVVNRTCFDNLLAHVDQDGHILCGDEHCPLHRSIVTGTPSRHPVLVHAQHKNGTRVPVEVSVAPVRNTAGEIVGGVESFRDLTEAQHDLVRAQSVQQAVLRCALPADPRLQWRALYQPSAIVGGDFYRCEWLGADLHVALVADVMGHGAAAALHTMLLRSLWDEHRATLPRPGALLRVLNDRVFPLVRGQGYFGTAVAVAYDAARGALCCARAGHPPPLRFHAGGVSTLGEPGPALGLLPDPTYLETTTPLTPGDTVLLYTDGAEEVPTPGGSELGLAGLIALCRDLLSARPGPLDLPTLEAQLLGRAGLVHLPDDLALLSLHRPA